MKNCGCVQRLEGKMSDFMRSRAGDDARATIQGTAFVITDTGLESVLQIPFRVKGSKKGYTSERGKEVGCNVSYCPFCGKPATRLIPEGKDEGIESAWRGLASPTSQGEGK